MYEIKNPIVFDNLNEYFVRAKSGEAERYFAHFLCRYESTLTRRASKFAENYSLGNSYTGDLKQIAAGTMWNKLKEYSTDNSIPFLQTVKYDVLHAWHEYARISCGATVVSSENMYAQIRKAAQIYYSFDSGTEDERITAVAKGMNLSDTDKARTLIRYAEQFRFSVSIGFDGDDEQSTGDIINEDRICDSTVTAEDEYFRLLQRKIISDIACKLSHNDLQILSLTTGVCPFCFRYIPTNEWRTYEQLALMQGQSDGDVIEKARKRILKKLKKALESEGF